MEGLGIFILPLESIQVHARSSHFMLVFGSDLRPTIFFIECFTQFTVTTSEIIVFCLSLRNSTLKVYDVLL